MTTTLKTKNSNVSGRVPDAGSLTVAELALNLKDRKLFSKDADGNVFEIGNSGNVPGGSTPPGSGNEVGDLFYDTVNHLLLYWNGSEWVPAAGDINLDDLADVSVETPKDGQVLVYDDQAGEWVAGYVGLNASPNEPSDPTLGDIWIDLSDCPPTLNIWNDCNDPGNPSWEPLGGSATTQGPVSIVSSNGTELNSTLTAVGGNGIDIDGTVVAATYEWTGAKTGNESTIVADVEGDYTVTATVTFGSGATQSDSTVWTIIDSYVDMVNNTPPVVGVVGEGLDGAYEGNSLYVVSNATVLNGINPVITETQWFKDGVADGTGSLYTIGNGDIGAKITAKQLFRDGRNNELLSDASNEVEIVVRPPSVITFTPAINDDGTADGNKVGHDLTAVAQSIVGGTAPIEYAFQWKSAGVDVGTTKTYTLQSSDVGNTITCDITVAEPDGSNAELRTATYGKAIELGVEIAKPEVLTPPDGAGIGGDISYFPKTSAIATVTPSGDDVVLALTNNKAYDAADNSEVSTIDKVFKAGDKVVGDGNVVFADIPAFRTHTYTGNGVAGKVETTNVDNTGKAMVWIKATTTPNDHALTDTVRGLPYSLTTSGNGAQLPQSPIQEFTDTGIVLNSGGTGNANTGYVTWNFRGAPGFFDVVAYEGNGLGSNEVPHSLGSEPGFIIIKNSTNPANWICWHKETGANHLKLNASEAAGASYVGYFDADTSNIQITNSSSVVNEANAQYVAYLFADTAGKIKCGSYQGSGGSGNVVDCGFQVGWVLVKNADESSNWAIFDTKRGDNVGLQPSSSGANHTFSSISLGSNGFTVGGNNHDLNLLGKTFIYIAIAHNVDAGQFMPTGVLTEDAAGTSMTLTDVTGEWVPGLTAVNETEVTETAPGADDIVFTSSKPDTVTGDVNTWGEAEWELSIDSGFVDKQEASVSLQNVDVEQGPTTFTLAEDTEYWVRTRYNSADPAADPSDWSDANKFKTAAPGGGAEGNFSTTVYPGTGATQTITNGVDLAGQGGLIWSKARTKSELHALIDTERGGDKLLYSNLASSEGGIGTPVIFNSDGYTMPQDGTFNESSSYNYVSWSFAAAKGFFDVVTYTGTGSNKTVPHSLGTTTGLMIVKRANTSASWSVYHKELGAAQRLELETTFAASNASDCWSDTEPTSTEFSVGTNVTTNNLNDEYVAYLFADNPDGGIKCGKFTGGGSLGTPKEVDCGFQAGWLMVKRSNSTGTSSARNGWMVWDSTRGFTDGNSPLLLMNKSDTEVAGGTNFYATANGFAFTEDMDGTGTEYIFVAIADTTVTFYDENTASTVTNHTLTKRYGVDPLETDLRKFGIYPLTEQPTYSVDTYVKEGEAYNPIRNYTSELNRAQQEAAEANARLDERDQQIKEIQTSFEARIAALEAKGDTKPSRRKKAD